MARLRESKLSQALFCVLGVFLTVESAIGVYRRWPDGGLRLVTSIAGVLLFGFCAYSGGYFVVTGRHVYDRFTRR